MFNNYFVLTNMFLIHTTMYVLLTFSYHEFLKLVVLHALYLGYKVPDLDPQTGWNTPLNIGKQSVKSVVIIMDEREIFAWQLFVIVSLECLNVRILVIIL